MDRLLVKSMDLKGKISMNARSSKQLFAAPLDWLRKNLEIDHENDELFADKHQTGKRNRSQSLMVSNPCSSSNNSAVGFNKKLFTQHSLDCGQLLNNENPFYEEMLMEEEQNKLVDGTSNILQEGDVKFISKNLPTRLVLEDWNQVFSTGKARPLITTNFWVAHIDKKTLALQ